MKHVNSLTDLLLHNLGELYDAETQQLKRYSKLTGDIGNQDLEAIITRQRESGTQRLHRLESAFGILDEKVNERDCDVMDELLDRLDEINDKVDAEEVRNAGIIMAVQCISHYKIAAYGTTAAFAKTLKLNDIAELLHTTVEEEKALDRELTTLAEQKINSSALSGLSFM